MVLAAVGQICSTASLAHNLAQCKVAVQKAVAAGAKILFLPEASDYIATSPSESLSLCQSTTTSPFVLGLQSLASQHSLAINVGVHEPSPSPKHLYNTLLHISPQGSIVATYRKLHLFDVDLSSTNGPVLKESATTSPGTTISAPTPSPIGLLGMQICFDLRFPEPSLQLSRKGATTLLYPSAFTPRTGAAHWSTLLRARAIENQCFVVAAAQVGKHNAKRESYGHSVVVDPWGEVLLELGGLEEWNAKGEGWEPEVGVVDVDLDRLGDVRAGMPLRRRTDVYPEL
ncbi:hypothetical protein ANO11243_057820 [Dothideomycetidae sp. 11243]|nr:hypothetical protein ANO11243_057820 [fungal sp. No.11243]